MPIPDPPSSSHAPALRLRYGTLERPGCIPTLERGNEKTNRREERITWTILESIIGMNNRYSVTPMPWNIAEAKQRFSEIVRQAAEGPQLIYNRKRLVAAVIDAEDYLAFQEWSDLASRRTLADEFAELRQIMREEDYELTVPHRSTRANACVEAHEEEAGDLAR